MKRREETQTAFDGSMTDMIHIALALCLILLPSSLIAQSKTEEADRLLLAAGKNVFVEKADHDVDVAMLGELKKWSRWKIVADESETDLLVRMRVSGSDCLGHRSRSSINP
jgi:hypothetical protein